MQIRLLEEVGSTQEWLKNAYKEKMVMPPFAVYAKRQTQGVGSRGNSWIGQEGNLFLSLLIERTALPEDLPMESASIYFACLLKEVLQERGSKCWIKWPNDFYIESKKIGGMITTIVGESLICGVGLNLVAAPKGFSVLDVEMSAEEIVKRFLENVEKKISWKQVFRKYSVEFYKNKSFYTHVDKNTRVSMQSAVLNDDGSITINGERIYSLR